MDEMKSVSVQIVSYSLASVLLIAEKTSGPGRGDDPCRAIEAALPT
jgi:hypothetical protein